MSDALNPAVRSLIELFQSDLAAVKFPDLDASVLAMAAEAVARRAEALSRAEAALDEARADLSESQEALLSRAHRALSYAKVFSEEDAALTAKLEAIALPRAPRRASRETEPLLTATEMPVPKPTDPNQPAPKRRGRPPKSAISTSAPLFGPMPEAPVPELAPAEG